MASIAERLAAELGEECKTNGARKAAAKNGTKDPIYALANGVDTRRILDHYGLTYDENGRCDCPGCGLDDSKLCDGGGTKCLHDRCAHAGPPDKPGFRTNVDIVMERESVDQRKAAETICGWFGIEIPKRSDDGYVHTDDDDPNAPSDTPTPKDPLRGLKHLGPIAVIGRARLVELAAKRIEYVWQDIALAGTIVLIAGAPGEGKTTLLFLIVAARSNPGEPVHLLARRIDPAPAGKWIVVIEGEHSEASAARKLVKSVRLLGVHESALERFIVIARKAVRLGSPQWGDVVRLVAAGLVSDIAIDTVARVAPANADSEAEQVAVFDAIAQAIEKAPEGQDKPLVWAAAHTRKNNMTGGLEDVSGSAQRTGQADTVLLLKGEKVDGRTISTRVTFAKLREEPDEYPLPVTFSIAPDAYGEPSIRVSVTRADDERPIETRILEQLHMGPKTKNALKTALGRNANAVEDALSALFEARAIRTTIIQVRGKDTKAFELRRDGKKVAGLWPDSGGPK